MRFVTRALWRAVLHNSLADGLPAFLPEAAYAQLKAVADPEGDFRSRLLGDYQLDLGAAHRLLGAEARRARLLGLRVPMSYAHWVPAGVCANRLGYWEVPNSRLIYRAGGAEESFGIASMISWRGVWYVVHLGAVLRSRAAGLVDEPSSGTGVSAYSSTC